MLSQDLTRYVNLHRSLGFKFRTQRLLLRNFVAFAEARGDEFMQIRTVLDWAALAPSPAQRRNRLLTARRFALALQAENWRHEIPAADAMGHENFKRRIVHVYRSDEIVRLMDGAAQLPPAGSIRPVMYSTLFGLLAVTGMRISEALALRLEDVTGDGLIVRESKFRKSRLLPLHDSTSQALNRYLAVRLRIGTFDAALFVSASGKAPSYETVAQTFRKLAKSIGLRGGPDRPKPRLHDLRHTMAVRSLELCPCDQKQVSRHILALSTYLGHAHVADTYWYLQTTPTLMRQIADVGEALHQEHAS